MLFVEVIEEGMEKVNGTLIIIGGINRMWLTGKRGKRGKTFLLILSILAICVSTVNFTYKYYTVDENMFKMTLIERKIDNVKAALKTESIRSYHIQKILNIISQYNRKMSDDQKYNIANEIYLMSLKYSNLDINLICATITHESALTWNPKIVSPVGALGLMQIMPSTGLKLCPLEGIEWTASQILFDPIVNIRLGCRYLSTLIHAYEIDGGLAAYNGGEKRAALWIKNKRDYTFLWEETRGYVPAVIRLYNQFRQESGIL
jgi:hypothetical protein